MAGDREQWTSKIGFILAAAGSAVGLGNIWKFPYLVGENGGAAFILLYLICVTAIGLPVVIAEILIGRTAQQNPVGSFRKLSGGSPFWMSVGFLGVLTGFIILSYYNVIAGLCLGYVVESIMGSFQGISPLEAGVIFQRFTQSSQTVIYHGLFMLLTGGIVYFGVIKGIEKSSKIMMPMLIVIILVLIVRGITLPGASRGLVYLLKPNFSLITGQTVLKALGQAFFSLSLGMGALLTYGSYLSKKDNIPTSAINIVVIDTGVALLAGFMIFPALFAMQQPPDQGEALIFNLLPPIFNYIHGGYIFRILFFVLLCLAALTSTISLLEVITTFLVDEYKFKRKTVVVIGGIVVFLLGIPSALSYNLLATIKICGLTIFGALDYLASNIFLPLGGICIALFAGWFWGRKNALVYIHEGSERTPLWLMKLWQFMIRYIAPILIVLVFLNSIGII